MGESVNLGELKRRLDALAVPSWRALVPLFLVALSLIESTFALARYPALFRPTTAGEPNAAYTIALLILHGGLLGGALLLRRDATIHGALHSPGGAGANDWAQPLRDAFSGGPSRVADAGSLRLTGLVFVVGAALLLIEPVSLWAAPILAATWVAGAAIAGLALGVVARARAGVIDLAGAGAALLLALLAVSLWGGTVEAPIGYQFIQLVLSAAALGVLMFIVHDDPSAGRALQLVSIEGFSGPFHWSPARRNQGKAYLYFGGSIPVIAFTRGLDEDMFRAVALSNVNASIPLHDHHLWIWNIAELSRKIPETIELDGQYISATAEISTTIGATAIDPEARFEQRFLDAAAQNLFNDDLVRKMRTALNTTFADEIKDQVEALEAIQRNINAPPTSIREFKQSGAISIPSLNDEDTAFNAYCGQLLPLEEAAAEYSRLAVSFSTECTALEREADETLAKFRMVTSAAGTRLSTAWRTQLAEKLRDGAVGNATLPLDEGRRILEMLGLQATIVSVAESARVQQLREGFAAARKAIEDRYETLIADVKKERSDLLAYLRQRNLIIDQGIANDPIMAFQARAQQQGLKRSDTISIQSGTAASLDVSERPKLPRER